jgi:PqqD family protein of HPr-rel-A system
MGDQIEPDDIGGSFAPAPRSSVASVELEGETVIYDVASGVSHLLNATVTAVWRGMDGDTTLDELAVDLAAAYGATETQVRDDVIAHVRRLGGHGLLRGVSSTLSG